MNIWLSVEAVTLDKAGDESACLEYAAKYKYVATIFNFS